MKRILSLILAAFMLLTVLIACADGSGDPSESADTQAQTDAETRLYADVPVEDFGGHVFTFYYWDHEGWTIALDIVAEEETGERINDAVYNRNMIIEDRYKVDFAVETDFCTDMPQKATQLVMAGGQDYDAIVYRGCEFATAVTAKTCLDLKTIPYLDFTKPWWDSNSAEEFTIGERLFGVAGDITIRDNSATACIYYNKVVYEDNHLDDPSPYQLVYDNEWTVDKMLDLTKNVARDLNGNSEVDGEDQYGIVSQRDTTYILFHGSGERYTAKDSDNLPVSSFDNERVYDVLTDIHELMTDHENFFNGHIQTDASNKDIFIDNRALFFIERVSVVEVLRNMEADFGILPIPKYSPEQENYLQSVSVHTSSILTVPKSATELDRTGIILEALACESKYTLINEYYDIVLKDKFTRDEESTDMLDIIFENRVFDLGEFFAFGGLNGAVLGIGDKDSFDPVSMYKQYEKKVDNDIDKLIDQIEAY